MNWPCSAPGRWAKAFAQLAAQCGLDTRVYDVALQRAKHAVDAIAAQLDKLVSKGKLTRSREGSARATVDGERREDRVRRRRRRHRSGARGHGPQVALFREVIPASPEGALLGSNTSSLSITELGAKIGAANRTVGLHFFNPPPVMGSSSKSCGGLRDVRRNGGARARAGEVAEKTPIV